MVLPPLQSSLICPTFNQADKLIVQLVLPRKYRTFLNSCFYISLCSQFRSEGRPYIANSQHFLIIKVSTDNFINCKMLLICFAKSFLQTVFALNEVFKFKVFFLLKLGFYIQIWPLKCVFLPVSVLSVLAHCCYVSVFMSVSLFACLSVCSFAGLSSCRCFMDSLPLIIQNSRSSYIDKYLRTVF